MRAAIRSSSHACRRGVVVVLLISAGLGLATGPPAAADGGEAPGNPATFRSISAGDFHACAIVDDGTVKCWGDNFLGQLGYGDQNRRGGGPGEMGDNLPTVDLGTGRTARAITAGGSHTCALLDNGTVKCWGLGQFGQLGYGSNLSRGGLPNQMGDNLPPVDLGTGRTAIAITAGSSHTCAILDTGNVKCWGQGALGQLGTGSSVVLGDGPGEMGDNLPTVALGTGRTATSLAVGDLHTCAVLDNSTVKCWGFNDFGQLGYGDTVERGDGPGEMGNSLPTVDLGTSRTATVLTAGSGHTCALLDDDTVKCWGQGDKGQLGNNSITNRGDGPGEMGNSLPAIDLGFGADPTGISAAFEQTCALVDDAGVKCWGYAGFGELGYGDTANRGDVCCEMGDNLPFVALGTGHTARAITAGSTLTCALLEDHTLKCWGNNDSGQLGIGDTQDRGDGPGEMGNELPVVDLGTGRTVVRMGIRVSIDANQAEVVAGQPINYFVTVVNTGERRLTNVRVSAPDVADCVRTIGTLTPGQVIFACNHTTSTDDIPVMTNQVLVTTGQGVFALSGTRRTRVLAPTYRPDGRLRLGAGAPIGNNVYNTTGAGQTRSATVPNLGTATFTATIENDGNAPDGFTVKGLGTTSRYTVTYRDGPTNITAQVLAGTYTLTGMAPGATHDLTITIKAKPGTPVGNTLSRLVTFTSNTTNAKDAVKATVRRR